jgi:cell division protein FtsQ
MPRETPAQRAPAPAERAGPKAPVAYSALRMVRFLAAVSTLCAVAAFPGSALFDLESVSVRGNAAVSAAEVRRLIGIAPGDSAFRVNASQIRERLRSDPRVEDTSVSLEFPHRLTLSVRERAPVAALRVRHGYVLLAADGVAISRATGPGPYLPLQVTRLRAPWVPLGTVVPWADVRLGATVAGALPDPLRQEVAGLQVDGSGEVVLLTIEGVVVRVGGADGILARLAAVPDVLAAVRARGMRVEYVDLRFPGSVVVKPVAASVPGRAGVRRSAPRQGTTRPRSSEGR